MTTYGIKNGYSTLIEHSRYGDHSYNEGWVVTTYGIKNGY